MIKMPDYLAADPHNFESYGELILPVSGDLPLRRGLV